jgi:prepilin-type N-terminal cleavage/methylation domain-containing protein
MGQFRRRAGVTLIELILVVVIAGIAAAMAIPHVNYIGFRMNQNAEAIRVGLQRAQALAISKQHNVIVSVYPNRNQLWIIEDNNDNMTWTAGERRTVISMQGGGQLWTTPTSALTTTGCSGNGTSGPMTGSKLTSTIPGTTSSGPAIAFRADGAASSDAQIYLTSARKYAADARAVCVLQSTGHVDWYKFVGGAWKRSGF